MECFLDRSSARLQPSPHQLLDSDTCMGPKMAPVPTTGESMEVPSPPPTPDAEDSSIHARIAQAVVTLLAPKIQEAVYRAVQQGMEQLHRELADHSQCIQHTEQCVSVLEDDFHSAAAVFCSHAPTQQALLEKINDLENQSRRNNL